MNTMAFSASNNDKDAISKDRLNFSFFPAYASYLLENKLEDYSREQLIYSFEENVPILKFLLHYSEAELLELAITSSREFLEMVAANRCREFIDKSTADFVTNRLHLIEREQVVAEDITIITFIRRKTLRKFLQSYSEKVDDFINIMEEVDRFVAESEAASFNAFIQVKQDNIRAVNEQLRQREDDLLEAQERADMGSFLWDIREGHSVYTPGVARIFELEGHSNLDEFMQYVHEEDRPRVHEALLKAMEKDGLYECEYRYKRHGDEKRIWSRGTVKFIDNEAVSMKGSIMDVTGKYNLLQKLQESEDANKLAQALTHIGNWQWDILSGQITWSDEMYRIYGLEPQSEDISFDRFLSLVHPEDRENRVNEIQESLKTLQAKDYVMRIVTPGGVTKVLKGKGELIVSKDGQPLKLVGTCQDITLEHKLNSELQEKERSLQELINSAPDAIIVIDEGNSIRLWNPKAEEIFGWSAEQVIGQQLTDTIIPEKYRTDHREGLSRLLTTGMPKILNKTLELTALNASGTEFPISLTVSQSIQQLHSSFIAFIRDISNDKQTRAELSIKKQQLEKMNLSLESKNNELLSINKELESFNYIASHDLQEPLRKIQTFIQLILEKGKDKLPPSTTEYFNKIMTSSARMKLLIEDLLMFSQATANEDKFEFSDLNMILEESQSILSTLIEEKQARIEADHLPELRVIPLQIQQLFLNLISNAIKYGKESQPPIITIKSQVVPGSVLQDSKAIPSASYFEIRVQDNGIGFEEENAEKIFGLFQRLHNKDKYSGTGIGLAICKKIVTNHHGFIRASGTPNKGSVFFVYLPMDSIQQKTSYLVN